MKKVEQYKIEVSQLTETVKQHSQETERKEAEVRVL